ncbi:MAG: divalent-cation tolerance protein CutA [Pleurocapsa sp.]
MEIESTQYKIVLVTVGSLEQGEKIAKAILTAKLAACINMFPINSWYWWEGEINSSREHQLIIKTNVHKFSELADKIKTLHDYEVPEIIAIPITTGSKSYLDWLGKSLK